MDKTHFETMKAKIAEFQKQMEEEGKELFLSMCTEFFAEHPTLLKFGWHQYTPYFNDGDECVFSAALDYPNMLLSGEGEYSDEDTWLDEEAWFKSEDKSSESILHGELREFLGQFDDEDVKMFFGDHCQVVVSRDGIEVEEYSHD